MADFQMVDVQRINILFHHIRNVAPFPSFPNIKLDTWGSIYWRPLHILREEKSEKLVTLLPRALTFYQDGAFRLPNATQSPVRAVINHKSV